jgi:hypothetical protein
MVVLIHDWNGTSIYLPSAEINPERLEFADLEGRDPVFFLVRYFKVEAVK